MGVMVDNLLLGAAIVALLEIAAFAFTKRKLLVYLGLCLWGLLLMLLFLAV